MHGAGLLTRFSCHSSPEVSWEDMGTDVKEEADGEWRECWKTGMGGRCSKSPVLLMLHFPACCSNCGLMVHVMFHSCCFDCWGARPAAKLSAAKSKGRRCMTICTGRLTRRATAAGVPHVPPTGRFRAQITTLSSMPARSRPWMAICMHLGDWHGHRRQQRQQRRGSGSGSDSQLMTVVCTAGWETPGWDAERVALADGWLEVRSVGVPCPGALPPRPAWRHARLISQVASAGPARAIQLQFPTPEGRSIHLNHLPGPTLRPGLSQQQLPRVSGGTFRVAGQLGRQTCTAETRRLRSKACHGCAGGRAAQVHRGEGGCASGEAALSPPLLTHTHSP